jgi:hypothetical protein
MDNEIMNYEEVMEPEVETCEVEIEETGMNKGLVVLIGAGVVAAGVAAVALGKKVWTKVKSKKAAQETEEEDYADVMDEEV